MINFQPSCSNEPHFADQWGLKNNTNVGMDINVCGAWDITKGNPNVVVAVADGGVPPGYSEFTNNYSSLSYDLVNQTNPARLYYDRWGAAQNHGLHVAGIIGANENGSQITGVAPLAKIMSLSTSLEERITFSEEMAIGMSYAWQNGAAVINNSWGDQGGLKPEYVRSLLLERALDSALLNGRGGKGCIIVCAAGNYGSTTPLLPIDYPANYRSEFLVVGAIAKTGLRWYASSYGTQLDVVAPGDYILSTIENNQLAYKSGTSMAAPHVAGIAALMLSANPNLTRQQVCDIIEKTSRKVGGYSYNQTKANGTWNNEMGYGLVDATAAVRMAAGLTTEFKNRTITTNTSVTGQNYIIQNVTVQSNKLTINASGDITILPPFEVKSGAQLELK